MPEGSNVTVGEAAEMLGTTKERIARLVAKGILTSRPSRLDARRKLIPRDEVERILRDEGYRPPTKPGRSDAGRRSRPRTAGLYTGSVKTQSDDVEEYLRDHWRAE